MGRPRNQPRQAQVSLATIIWANIVKWQTVRSVTDEELAVVLGVSRLSDRKRSRYITGDEIEKVCTYLAIEPEKLLER